jgi:hypothetical protein
MNRRQFLVTSGSTILIGGSIRGLNRQTVGIEFELSTSPDEKPINVDSILVRFTKLELTPQYLDESEEIDVTVDLETDEGSSVTKNASGIEFKNGECLDLSKIQSRSGADISDIVLDGISRSGSAIYGTCSFTVSHANISDKSYQKRFIISQQSTIVEGFEDNDLTEYTTKGSNNWSITSQQSYDGNYSLLHDESTTSTHHITSLDGDGLNQYPTRGDAIEARFYHDSVSDSDFDAHMGFLGESLDSNSRMRGYRIRISPRADTVSLVKWDGSNLSTLDSKNVSNYPTDQWNRIRIELKTDNEIVCKYFDSTGYRVAKLSRIDSEYNGGGITFIGNSGGGRRRFLVDNIFINDL